MDLYAAPLPWRLLYYDVGFAETNLYTHAHTHTFIHQLYLYTHSLQQLYTPTLSDKQIWDINGKQSFPRTPFPQVVQEGFKPEIRWGKLFIFFSAHRESYQNTDTERQTAETVQGAG